MGNDEISIYNSEGNPSSLETIKRFIKEGNGTDTSLLDEASNWFDKVPPILKVIAKHFDPTGIIGDIDEFLVEHKAQKEQERFIISLAMLYDMFLKYESEIRQAMLTMKDDFQALTEEYFIKCKESRQMEKLSVFRDIWFNSINIERPYSEKEYVFNLVSDLTIDQINVLRYIYHQLEQELREKGREHTRPIGIVTYSEESGLAYNYVQQMCVNLSGKGLLNQGAATMIQAEPTHFLPSAYMDTFVEYIKSCE